MSDWVMINKIDFTLMKVKNVKWLFIALALVLTVSMFAGFTWADATPNYGFIPNSGEASVSKVDLVSMTEVARYYTAPRSNPAPSQWRTSRIAQDADGNAWVINTGADGTDLQGSIVRIQADTEGLDTHVYSEDVYDFGTDEAVQVFLVGSPGDMPRAIAIDKNGYIWVGFYSGTQLMKYSYNEATKALAIVGGPYGVGNNISY